MELHGATATLAWSNSVSSLHFLPRPIAFYVSGCKISSIRCLNDSAPSQKADQMIVSITGATGSLGKDWSKGYVLVRVLTRSRSHAQTIFPGKKVHMCNKLASRHVRVGLAEPSEVPRCDICENAPSVQRASWFTDL